MQPHSSLRQQRFYGAVRTTLIGYGVAAFSYLLSRPSAPGEAADAGSASSLFLYGILLQLAVLIARVLVKKHASNEAAGAQMLAVIELLGDGVTVLLFAVGTFGGIMQGAGAL